MPPEYPGLVAESLLHAHARYSAGRPGAASAAERSAVLALLQAMGIENAEEALDGALEVDPELVGNVATAVGAARLVSGISRPSAAPGTPGKLQAFGAGALEGSADPVAEEISRMFGAMSSRDIVKYVVGQQQRLEAAENSVDRLSSENKRLDGHARSARAQIEDLEDELEKSHTTQASKSNEAQEEADARIRELQRQLQRAQCVSPAALPTLHLATHVTYTYATGRRRRRRTRR